MSIDTSDEAIERLDVFALRNLAHHLTRLDSGSGEAALMLRVAATMRRLRGERNEARAERDAARAKLVEAALSGAEAALDNDDRLLTRPDVSAILRGEAVAVPVEATREMVEAAINRPATNGEEMFYYPIYRAMIAASPYAAKEGT